MSRRRSAEQAKSLAKQPADPRRSKPALPWWKKLIFSAALCAAVFLLLEALLAGLGFRPLSDTHDPLVGFDRHVPLLVPDPQDDERLVTNPAKLEFFNRQTLQAAKPPGTARIFCLGGSTTYGRPFDNSTSFCGWLREMLPRLDPHRNWEVLNAGGVSYASYRVAALMEELAAYEPDVFVVYTGHNEFLEERTYRDVRAAPAWQKRVTTLLSRTRVYSAMHRIVRPSRPREFMPAEVDAVLDHTVGPESYHRDDLLRERVAEDYRKSLQRMVEIAQQCGAVLLLVTPASNLKDCSPFKSEISTKRGADALRLLEQGRALLSSGDAETALQTLNRALRLDGRIADVHYYRGRALLQQGRTDEAAQALERALEEDVCPLRALPRLVVEMRRIGRRHAPRGAQDVLLLDWEEMLVRRCQKELGHHCPGGEYFLDHVHPTVEMHGALAAAILNRLSLAGFKGVGSGRQVSEARRQAAAAIQSRIDPRRRAEALRNLAKVLNWAGKHYEAGELALQAVESLPRDAECHLLAAHYLQQTARLDEAARLARRAVQLRGQWPPPRRLLGALLIERRQWAAAAEQFRQLAELTPHRADVWHTRGAICLEQQRWQQARKFFERAQQLDEDLPQLSYHLALACHRLGDLTSAERHYQAALEADSQDADAHFNLALLMIEQGRDREAAEQLRAALKLRPDDQEAARQLKTLEGM